MVDTLRPKCEALSKALELLYETRNNRLQETSNVLKIVVAIVGHIVSITEGQAFLNDSLVIWLQTETAKLRQFMIHRMLATKSQDKASQYFTYLTRLWRTNSVLYGVTKSPPSSTEIFLYFQSTIETDFSSTIFNWNEPNLPTNGNSDIIGTLCACFKDLKYSVFKTLNKTLQSDDQLQPPDVALLMKFWCQLVTTDSSQYEMLIAEHKGLVTDNAIASEIDESVWTIIDLGEREGTTSLAKVLSLLDENVLSKLSSPLILAPKFMKVMQNADGGISLEQTVKTLKGLFTLICNHRLCLDPEDDDDDEDDLDGGKTTTTTSSGGPNSGTIVSIMYALICH